MGCAVAREAPSSAANLSTANTPEAEAVLEEKRVGEIALVPECPRDVSECLILENRLPKSSNAARIAADLALLPGPIPAVAKRCVWSEERQDDKHAARETSRQEAVSTSEIEHVSIVEPVERLEDEIAYVAARKARRAAKKAKKCNHDEEDQEAAARKARRAARKVAKTVEAEIARKAGKASWAEKKKAEVDECVIYEKPPKQLPPLSFHDSHTSTDAQLPQPTSCW